MNFTNIGSIFMVIFSNIYAKKGIMFKLFLKSMCYAYVSDWNSIGSIWRASWLSRGSTVHVLGWRALRPSLSCSFVLASLGDLYVSWRPNLKLGTRTFCLMYLVSLLSKRQTDLEGDASIKISGPHWCLVVCVWLHRVWDLNPNRNGEEKATKIKPLSVSVYSESLAKPRKTNAVNVSSIQVYTPIQKSRSRTAFQNFQSKATSMRGYPEEE